jgi:3-dehydroquinate synthase
MVDESGGPMHTVIPIHLSQSYELTIESGVLLDEHRSTSFFSYWSMPPQSLVLVTDEHLSNYAQKLESQLKRLGHEVLVLMISPGEASKTRETKQWIEDQMLSRNLGKSTRMLALGGGVVSDLTGFVAATYARGIDVYYLPTTLLAMVDATIGGKTAVNTPWAKNAIGCIVQPKHVFIDPQYLSSLTHELWLEGWVEMIKHALISDAAWYQDIEQGRWQWFDSDDVTDMLIRSCKIKKYWVEQDEYDQHARQVLNFGHTFAHAIEQASDYQISHGRAVAMGLVIELYVSSLLFGLDKTCWQRVLKLFKIMGINLQTEVFQDETKMLQFLALDKKNHAKQINMVALSELGSPVIRDGRYAHAISSEVIRNALRWARNHFCI